jgi:hypothetical protein
MRVLWVLLSIGLIVVAAVAAYRYDNLNARIGMGFIAAAGAIILLSNIL